MEDGKNVPRLQWVLLFLFLVLSSFSADSSLISATSPQKVTLELYYESLCPYCSNLIVNYLYKIFETDIIDITELKLIPYGNAKIRPNSTIVCQHGPYECLLNTIEACAIDVWPDVSAHFPFVYCVEKLVYEGKKTEWETCFEKLGLDQKPVYECYESGRGKELELGYAAVTNSLQPPHTYVPWVTVDGQPLYDTVSASGQSNPDSNLVHAEQSASGQSNPEIKFAQIFTDGNNNVKLSLRVSLKDYVNFVSYICKAYKGTPLPSACSGLSIADVNKKENTNILTPVCYTWVKIKSLFSDITSAVMARMRGFTMAAFE